MEVLLNTSEKEIKVKEAGEVLFAGSLMERYLV